MGKIRISKLLRHWVYWLLSIALALAAYAIAIEPNWPIVNRLTLELPHLAPAFTGYRIVQISDIHLGDGGLKGMPAKRLHRFVALVNDLQPDLVAITGDFVSYTPSPFATVLEEELSHFQARDGAVAVLGNHDHWLAPNDIRSALHNANVLELQNDVYTIDRNGDLLNVAGVDDVWQGGADLARVLQRMPAKGAGILLAHEPDFADTSAASGRFDLQLSGHSHGGQVRFPLLPPPVLPFMAERYPKGLYRVGHMWQYTNIGLGTISLPIRFFCRPEITELTLTPSPQRIAGDRENDI